MKSLILRGKQLPAYLRAIDRRLRELEWAHVYHDSIRGNEELQNLSLKVGRWAGNYSLFYLLHRILKDFEPESIVELGLGESSKFISTYNRSVGNPHTHVAIEQDAEWASIFQKQFNAQNMKIVVNPIQEKSQEGFTYNGYQSMDTIPIDGDFYLVDGPFGTARYSRFDIVHVIEQFESDKEFVLVLDDFNRQGEKDTAQAIQEACTRRNISYKTATFVGVKSQFVLVTPKYNYVRTL